MSIKCLIKFGSFGVFFYSCVTCLFFQVLSAATIVAKHTSALCNACRLASSKTSNPVARRQFVQSAKEVANTTANLVKTIKVNSPTDQNVECKFVTAYFFPRQVRSCQSVYNSLIYKNTDENEHTFKWPLLVSGLRWGFF